MNVQKIQICLLAIIAVALVYIAITYTNANRYVVFAEGYATLDTRSGNIHLLKNEFISRSKYGTTYYLYKEGYSTFSPELIDYITEEQDTKKLSK